MNITQARFAGSSTRVADRPSPHLPEFAFIGRSNVGKSSLINMLTGNGKLAMTSSKPGKTRLVNHFLINDSWYLVDLPGYGYAKVSQKGRDALADVVRDYIHNSPDLTLLFVLVDSRHEIGRIDIDFIAELGENGIPFAIIFTKADKMGPVAVRNMIDKDCEILLRDWEELPPVFLSSSQSGQGREEILKYIDTVLKSI
ncbi:MAG: ribosome biogenesis GTP-binding protein YihA/YsxC [Bacteroidales bacterium]|nr:ribosome biogenesis GTP-binding protein YihA/YsxC [Bacteroidales bacterium]MDY3783371.1 ribosome biogenesis GTP-binding protein YihA/YsxC [Candidatus Cryptobacteroides sp.]